MEKNDQNSLISLSEIKGIFIIPDFQRGYRWGEAQINAFMNDIKNARDRNEGNYFLQAIVVKRNGERDGKPLWELIDGQQRLTTAWILNGVLCKILDNDPELPPLEFNFSLDYQSRPDSGQFLKSLVKSGAVPANADSNVDFWHMAQAKDLMRKWAISNRLSLATFREFFMGKVNVLWHEDGENVDAAAHFVSINSGRIPLEDAELCRALLLAGKHMNVGNELPPESGHVDEADRRKLKEKIIRNHQIVMGADWDRIERELREKSLWGFLNGPADLPVHMGYLLQIIYDKDGFSGQHPCFHEMENELYAEESPSDSIEIWNRISFDFDRLAGWNRDNDYYHWLGYLSTLEKGSARGFWHNSIKDAIANTEDKFKSNVFDAIKATVCPPQDGDAPDLASFEYKQQKTENLLLLFNVEYARRASGIGARFPFHEHHKLHWSIEHINAQKLDIGNDQKVWKEWLTLHKQFLDASDTEEGIALANECAAMLKKGEKRAIEPEKFIALRDKIQEYAGAPTIEQNSLLNLVLLDLSKNVALSNSLFDIKQGKIKTWLSFGEDAENPLASDFYIPIGTQAVLMRHFTRGASNESIWSSADMEGYDKALRNILSVFWPALKNANPGQAV